MFSVRQTGGDVCPLTFSRKLFQVLQRDLFVPRAVCQTVIDHRVLKGNKHSLVIDTRRRQKGTSWTTGQMGVLRLDRALYVALRADSDLPNGPQAFCAEIIFHFNTVTGE